MAAASAAVMENVRPRAGGKFIYLGDQKFYVRGVTYGPFRPDADGGEYHSPDVVERDFAQMAANGLNAVRTYTVPPCWLLDLAQRHGLRVMVGLPWEQHIAAPALFLDQACETIFTEYARAVDAMFTPGLLGWRTMRAWEGGLVKAPTQACPFARPECSDGC